MDEQTIQQPTSQEPEPQEFEDTGFDDEGFDNGQEPEISLNNEGEVKFSDDFFGDLPEDTEPEPKQEQQEQPNYYTEDELRNTPYEQWDFNRFPKEVQSYANILNEQNATRQRAQEIQQRQVRPLMQEPHQYTAKELSVEANKLAMQNLGIKDDYEIDEYDRDYQSALKLAQDELIQKRNGELADYQRRSAELQQLQQFNAQIAAQPDYAEYEKWYRAKCQAAGVTPEQVNAGLNELARRNGERYSQIQNYVAGWYREFQTEKAQRQQLPKTRRRTAPPVLEGTQGGFSGSRSYSMEKFSEMDSDGQAKALMDMGIV